jgi:hypothetical protein
LTDELGRKLFEEAVRGEEGKSKGKGKGVVAPVRLSSEDERSLSRSVAEQKRRRRLEGRAHL